MIHLNIKKNINKKPPMAAMKISHFSNANEAMAPIKMKMKAIIGMIKGFILKIIPGFI